MSSKSKNNSFNAELLVTGVVTLLTVLILYCVLQLLQDVDLDSKQCNCGDTSNKVCPCVPQCEGKCGGVPDGCGGTCDKHCTPGTVCFQEECISCGNCNKGELISIRINPFDTIDFLINENKYSDFNIGDTVLFTGNTSSFQYIGTSLQNKLFTINSVWLNEYNKVYQFRLSGITTDVIVPETFIISQISNVFVHKIIV